MALQHIRSVHKRAQWIGLHRVAPQGTVFEWTSGDPSQYRAWASGYPISTADYAILWLSGSWHSAGPAPDQTYDAYVGIIETSPCRCDWNLDGDRTSADFFAFLNDCFTGSADFDCSGSTTTADFFDFLTCFLAAAFPESCPGDERSKLSPFRIPLLSGCTRTCQNVDCT